MSSKGKLLNFIYRVFSTGIGLFLANLAVGLFFRNNFWLFLLFVLIYALCTFPLDMRIQKSLEKKFPAEIPVRPKKQGKK